MNILYMKHALLPRIIVAAILIQTLWFKFNAAPESVYIFSNLGIEPWGRYLSGAMELVAAILLLVPATIWVGGILALGIISGALMSHFTILGIEVLNDNGLLFILALLVFAGSIVVLVNQREKIPVLNKMIIHK